MKPGTGKAVNHARIEVRADAVVLHRAPLPQERISLQTQGLQEALTALLAPVRDSLRADVVVSAVHARLLVLPCADALSSEARWLSYAASRFEDVFGEGADGWSLRVIPERPQRPRLLAALPMALLRTLDELMGQRLDSVRIGTLMHIDAVRQLEAGYTGALVDLDDGHAVVALLVDGTLRRVRLRRMAPRVDELRAALRVEWAALGHGSELPALVLATDETQPACDAQQLLGLAPRVLTLH